MIGQVVQSIAEVEDIADEEFLVIVVDALVTAIWMPVRPHYIF